MIESSSENVPFPSPYWMTFCAWGRRDPHLGQVSNLLYGNSFETATRAFPCHLCVIPCISSQFWVASCTSRCNSYQALSFPVLINENASKTPKAIVTSICRSESSRKRLSGIPCRSRHAISDSISAACGFCFWIMSKDIFHVFITEW